MTTTMYENGNTFQVKLQKATTIDPGKNYIKVDGEPFEVISKVRTNTVTITDQMSEAVKPKTEVQ